MQEKRFLLVVFLTRRDGYHSSQDLASGIQDNHSNVICNLNMLASAGIVIADREPATGIVRLAINRGLLQNLEEFFATGALKESG